MLMKRSHLESMGATLVCQNGHPSYFAWTEQPLETRITVQEVI